MTMSMLLGYLESVGSRKGMLKPGVVVMLLAVFSKGDACS